MAKLSASQSAVVGVTEHGNSAILVTIGSDGALLDRRKVDLTTDLPTHPYHHQGSWAVGRYKDSPWAKDISLPDAIKLVETVEIASGEGARAALESLRDDVPAPITGIAIRGCPELPPTIEERIRDNRAQSMADTVMYRQALAAEAEALDWEVSWYDRDTVFDEAAKALGRTDIQSVLKEMGREAGPPWQAKHKQAAAAAIAAVSG